MAENADTLALIDDLLTFGPSRIINTRAVREVALKLYEDNLAVRALVEAGIPPNPVEGLGDGTVWAAGTAYTTLSNATRATGRVIAQIEPTDEGILMEAGGTGNGLILFAYQGAIHFRCGDGGKSLFGANAEISAPIPPEGGERVITWSADSASGLVCLYVDDELQAITVLRNVSVTGNDAGGIGRVYGSAPSNLGGWSADGAGPYSNTIVEGRVWAGQVTPHVQAFSTLPDFTRAPADGLTKTATWSDPTRSYNDLREVNTATLVARATFSNADSGVIVQAGGGTAGLLLYVHEGWLYLRAGVGNDSAFRDRVELSWPIPAGAAAFREVAVSASSSRGLVTLWVDRRIVGTATLETDRLTDTQGGKIGGTYGVVPSNRAGWAAVGDGPFTGTIAGVDVYAGQPAGPVAACLPLGPEPIVITGLAADETDGRLTVTFDTTSDADGYLVQYRKSGASWGGEVTDYNGSVEFGGLDAGIYEVRVAGLRGGDQGRWYTLTGIQANGVPTLFGTPQNLSQDNAQGAKFFQFEYTAAGLGAHLNSIGKGVGDLVGDVLDIVVERIDVTGDNLHPEWPKFAAAAADGRIVHLDGSFLNIRYVDNDRVSGTVQTLTDSGQGRQVVAGPDQAGVADTTVTLVGVQLSPTRS